MSEENDNIEKLKRSLYRKGASFQKRTKRPSLGATASLDESGDKTQWDTSLNMTK